MNKQINQLLNSFCESLKPPPLLNVWQWADQYRFLDETSAEPGLYRTDRTPYLKKIMECLSESHPCQKIVFAKSAQVGGSESANNYVGYIMHQSPSAAMYVLPSKGEAEKYAKDRLDKMIDICPSLQEVKSKKKGKSDTNTILRKEFKGGFLNLVGAQSAKGLRSTPIKYLILDEVDAYPPDVDGEGDPVKLAEKRTSTFSRSKVFLISTPTIDKFSRIDKEFRKGSMQYYNCPCPTCGFMQKLIFPQLKFKYIINEDGKKEVIKNSVYYECLSCKEEIKEHNKTKMLEKGEWIAENPNAPPEIQSFHINALYSPVGWKMNWALVCQEFLEAEIDKLKYKTFVNTILGETYKEDIEQPNWTKLKERAEDYLTSYIPENCVALFASIDVQKDRLAYHIIGFGENLENWIIDYDEIYGDPIYNDVWEEVDKRMKREFLYENNKKIFLKVSACAVDTGYLAEYVYDFVRKDKDFYYAIKGDRFDNGRLYKVGPEIDKTINNKTYNDSIRLYWFNTQQAKKTLYQMLKNDSPGPRYVHFSLDLEFGDDYYKMLVSEVLITKVINGNYVQMFDKPTNNTRNEALDTYIYAYILAKIFKVDDLQGKNYIKYKEKILKENIVEEEKENILKEKLKAKEEEENKKETLTEKIIKEKVKNVNNGFVKNDLIFTKKKLF